MVDRQFVRLRCNTAVLAHEPVSFEQVPTAERNTCVRKPIVSRQRDHFGNTNLLRNGLDERTVFCRRLVSPIAPVVQLIVINVDYLCAVAEYQRQCAPYGGDVYRLPIAVENQRWLVQHLRHLRFLRGVSDLSQLSYYDIDWRIYTVRFAIYGGELALISRRCRSSSVKKLRHSYLHINLDNYYVQLFAIS